MGKSVNKAMLIGNLGQDPEVRTIPSGARVAQFSLATSRRWNDKNGQPQEKTEWHRVVAWEKLADVVDKFAKKGDRIYVEGEIEYRQYQDKDNLTRYTTEIRAREIVLLGGGKGEGGGEGAKSRQRELVGAGAGGRGGSGDYDDFQAPGFGGEDDDDLPF